MTIGTAIFLSVCIILITFIFLPREETQTIQSLPCKCKDCSNYKDCPIGAGKAILVWKEKESQEEKINYEATKKHRTEFLKSVKELDEAIGKD